MLTLTYPALIFGLLVPHVGHEAQKEKQPRSIVALLTQVHGHVRVSSPDRSREKPARVRQALVAGDRLELGGGASVTLLCTNAIVRRLRESAEVNPDLCSPGTRGHTPASSGLQLHFGSLELVGEARGHDGEDFDRRPIIVSPRCPSDTGVRLSCFRLLEPAPTLRWLEVAGAEAYRLDLIGRRHDERERVTVRAVEVVCTELETLGGRRMCSLTWPQERWPSMDSQSYQLKVVAIGGPESGHADTTLLVPVPTGDAEKVRRALSAVSRLDLDASTEILTHASIFAGFGLINGAVRILETAVGESTHPVLNLALGDAYLDIDLPELALSSYRSASAAAGDALDLRGEAELGLGWAHGLLGRDSEALHHLREAWSLFCHTGLHQEAASAIRALAEVYERRGEKDRARRLRQRAKALAG